MSYSRPATDFSMAVVRFRKIDLIIFACYVIRGEYFITINTVKNRFFHEDLNYD
jgi:hypothetical protein